MQRARDGWAWYTFGRLLPNYREIEVEGEEERFPYLANSDFNAWQHIPVEDSQAPQQLNDEQETPFVPSQLTFEQAEPTLPGAPTGGASRRAKGELRLPPLPPPPELPPPDGDEHDEGQRMKEEHSSSMETPGDTFPSQGGGASSLFPVARCLSKF